MDPYPLDSHLDIISVLRHCVQNERFITIVALLAVFVYFLIFQNSFLLFMPKSWKSGAMLCIEYFEIAYIYHISIFK